jgi:hypothetical protein
MDKEDLKKLAENPNFIQGIYNYCDRWCERCPFTLRCLNFAMDSEELASQEEHDIDNEAFWQQLTETFQMTLELLHEAAEREGIDLDDLDSEYSEEEHRLKNELARDHQCARAAKFYIEMADDWFDSARDFFGQDEEEPTLDPFLDEADDREDETFKDALEVVGWYQHLIYVKLMRAVRGELEERSEILDEFPRDSDGSAKVALIGIDRSIAAWGEIRNYFPHRSDDVLDILVHLEQLRRKVEKVFPNARAFIRPGFDKIDLNS